MRKKQVSEPKTVKPKEFTSDTMIYKRENHLCKKSEYKDMQLEINKFKDKTDIYKIIQKYERGDTEALNANTSILNIKNENGEYIELNLADIPRSLNEANKQAVELARIKAEQDAKIEQLQKQIESMQEIKPNTTTETKETTEPTGGEN